VLSRQKATLKLIAGQQYINICSAKVLVPLLKYMRFIKSTSDDNGLIWRNLNVWRWYIGT